MLRIPDIGNGRLVSTEIENRDGKSYEKNTYNKNGAINTTEDQVSKDLYQAKIDLIKANAAINETEPSAEKISKLEALRDACL